MPVSTLIWPSAGLRVFDFAPRDALLSCRRRALAGSGAIDQLILSKSLLYAGGNRGSKAWYTGTG